MHYVTGKTHRKKTMPILYLKNSQLLKSPIILTVNTERKSALLLISIVSAW